MKVALSIGEDYPHLFVSTEENEVAYAEGSQPDMPDYLRNAAAVELTEQEWADYQQAEDRYYEWIRKLDDLREAALKARRGGE